MKFWGKVALLSLGLFAGLEMSARASREEKEEFVQKFKGMLSEYNDVSRYAASTYLESLVKEEKGRTALKTKVSDLVTSMTLKQLPKEDPLWFVVNKLKGDIDSSLKSLSQEIKKEKTHPTENILRGFVHRLHPTH